MADIKLGKMNKKIEAQIDMLFLSGGILQPYISSQGDMKWINI